MVTSFVLRDMEDTKQLGRYLASLARPSVGILFYGDLGAGKTTLVRFIAEALGEKADNVSSPTFAIIHEYDTVPPMAHVDLYRLGKEVDVYELGLDEYVDRGFCLAVEWAEYMSKDEIFGHVIEVRLEFLDEHTRKAVIVIEDEEG